MRKRRYACLVVLFFVLLWAGCEQQRESIPAANLENHPIYKRYTFSNDEKVIELGASLPSSTVTHLIEVMKRDQILKQELAQVGYTVKFYFFQKGGDVMYFIKNDSLKGAFVGDMPTLMMASSGKVTIISLFSKVGVALVSRDVYRVRDLKNMRVAYPYGSNAHYYLLKLLKENGLSEADIIQVQMDNREMLDAIRQKRIDAFTTFEPTAMIYTKMDPTLHIINRSLSSYNFFSVRKEYASKNPRAVRAILAAQFRAMFWLRESDRNLNRASRWVAEETMKIVSLPMDKYIANLNALCDENLLGNITDYFDVVSRSVLADDGDIRKEFDFLKTKGIIPQQQEWNDVKRNFDTLAVPDVLKNMRHTKSRIRP